jgi:hypothetical protein
MRFRHSFAVMAVALLVSACGNVPDGSYSCKPPAYCGSQKTYDNHGQG